MTSKSAVIEAEGLYFISYPTELLIKYIVQ